MYADDHACGCCKCAEHVCAQLRTRALEKRLQASYQGNAWRGPWLGPWLRGPWRQLLAVRRVGTARMGTAAQFQNRAPAQFYRGTYKPP